MPTSPSGPGWWGFNMETVSGSGTLKIAPRFSGQVRSLRIYNRYLTTSEAIGNYRAGSDASK